MEASIERVEGEISKWGLWPFKFGSSWLVDIEERKRKRRGIEGEAACLSRARLALILLPFPFRRSRDAPTSGDLGAVEA